MRILNKQRFDRFDIRTVAFIGPAPARIRGLSNHRCEVPQHMAEFCFICSDLSDPVQQVFITGSAHADIMGEIDSADTVVHAVYVILPVDIGDTGL